MSPQRRTALLSVVAAGTLIALKLGVGLASHSLGLLSEAAHSGTDLVAALLTFFAVGVAARPWSDVERAVAADPRGVPCLVLRLKDGATTTIPVEALDGDRDAFAHDVRERLQAAVRRR